MDHERPPSHGNYKSGSSRKRTNSELDNGRYKRLNTSHGHNSVNAKTIETIYRILCPVKKIGSVLGKGGDIVNALREETNAKIRVADAIPGADERVIIIFNYSKHGADRNEISEDIESVNPSEGDNQSMKSHCPAQDALLKIHSRIAADEFMRGGVVHEKTEPNDVVIASILVPNNQVGCLLGKGGDVIQKLRRDTSANIRILPSEHLPPCAMNSDELVQISGKPNIVQRALYEISTLLHHHPRKDNPSLEEILSASTRDLYQSGPAIPPPAPHGIPIVSSYTPPLSWFDGYRNESSSRSVKNGGGVLEDFSMKILCATEKIGGIIGKGGANVRQLERQTGAIIHVEGTDPDDAERIIIVTAKEALSNPISPTIEAVLLLHRRTNEISVKGAVTTRLLVSSSKIGCLLGQGGNIITEMRRRTRADIRVFPKTERPKYASADEELVQISGNENVAETALSEIASRLRTRSLQGGPAPVNPLPAGPPHGFAPSESLSRSARPPSAIVGSADPVLYDYPRGYDYPKGYDQPKGFYDYPKGYDHPKGYDYPNGYDYTKSYEYPKSYDYPKGSDYAKNYEYPKDAGQQYNSQSYPGPQYPAGYSDMSRSAEIRTPKSSALGIGGNNFPDAHQVPPNPSWRYMDR